MPELSAEIERVVTPFNTVSARRRGAWIDLDVEGATYASWHPERLLTGYSWDALSAAAVLAGAPASVLVLGLGGGTCLRQLRALAPAARLVGVEIDPGVLGLARRHMHLNELEVEVHEADADEFLAGCDERFDAVLDDLYLTGPEDVYRAGVPEGERLAALARATGPGGVVVANLIIDKGHEEIRARAGAAFVEAFPEVRVVRPPRGLNEILVGGEQLGDRHSLRKFAGCYASEQDRRLWERIAVRRLG